MTGRPSSVFLIGDGKAVFLKKLRSATRWQSGLELISASVAAVPSKTGEDAQGVPMAALRLLRVRLSRMPSAGAKKKSLSLMSGPPKLPPNWLRRKLSRGLPSEVAAVRASVRKYSKALP